MGKSDERKFLGKITIPADKILVTDPCYRLNNGNPSSLQLAVDHDPSRQIYCFYELSDEGIWGRRIRSISAVYSMDNKVTRGRESLGLVGVDSGQMGFFDFDRYTEIHDDEMDEYDDKDLSPYDSKCSSNFYVECCKKTLESADYVGITQRINGFVSSSGFGDGMYEVYELLDDNDALAGYSVIFIDDDDEEDYY